MRRRAGLALIAGAGVAAALGLRGGGAAEPPPAAFLGAFRWRMDDPRFGGLSAIHVHPGGQRFLAVSDRGAWTEGRLLRDAGGRIRAVEAAPFRLLLARGMVPLAETQRDAEGIAVASDGTLYLSFEGPGGGRILRYPHPGAEAETLPVHADFVRMQDNASLEALAIGPDGALYAIPERSGRIDRPFPVYRFRGGVWDVAFAIPRTPRFLPVAADIGPDGRLTLLERHFEGIRGFASRIRRFDLAGGGGEAVLETPVGRHDNLEGLSVWRDGAGRLVATMVSDDNFNRFQRTEIVEYALPD